MLRPTRRERLGTAAPIVAAASVLRGSSAQTGPTLVRVRRHEGLTPLGVVARGALAGAVGTLAMDLLWYIRYRRDGGASGFADWEFSAGLDSWDNAPAPAQFGKRVFETVFDRELAAERAPLVNNLTHWATGVGWGAAFGLVAASVPTSRAPRGLVLGAVAWLQSYVVLVPAKLYKPPWEYDPVTLWKDLSAHLVYGLVTDTAFRALAKPRVRAAAGSRT